MESSTSIEKIPDAAWQRRRGDGCPLARTRDAMETIATPADPVRRDVGRCAGRRRSVGAMVANGATALPALRRRIWGNAPIRVREAVVFVIVARSGRCLRYGAWFAANLTFMPDPRSEVASYRYINEKTGDVALVTLPAPCDPATVRALDDAMARCGYEREEGEAPEL